MPAVQVAQLVFRAMQYYANRRPAAAVLVDIPATKKTHWGIMWHHLK